MALGIIKPTDTASTRMETPSWQWSVPQDEWFKLATTFSLAPKRLTQIDDQRRLVQPHFTVDDRVAGAVGLVSAIGILSSP